MAADGIQTAVAATQPWTYWANRLPSRINHRTDRSAATGAKLEPHFYHPLPFAL